MAKISKAYSRILVILLALLGFSCKSENGFDRPIAYGTPNATFKAKGVVVSETNDTPIEGIRAVLKAAWGIDTVYTDNKGGFNLKSMNFDFYEKLYVELSDVDGEENGLFTDMDIEADYSKETFKGGDKKWYRGEAEKDLGIIKMEAKE